MTDIVDANAADEEAIAAKAAEDIEAARVAEDAKVVEPKDDKNAVLDTATWGDLKDDVGNSVLLILQKSGVTPEVAKALLYDATVAGKPDQIDRDKLIEAVGAANATLIMSGVENYTRKQADAAAAKQTVLNEAVGGKENWDKVLEWAKANLSAEDRAEYAELVNAGGRKATLAAKDLKAQYEEKNGTLTKQTVVPGTDNGGPKDAPGLNRADYYAELEKLNRTGKLTQGAQSALWQRRLAGQKQGI